MITFDTSALVKLVVVEHETHALRAWLTSSPEQPWVASALCRVEVVRAVARAEPAALSAARQLLDGLDLVPLSPALLDTAAALPPPSLRSPDAVHLATAAMRGPELTAFVVYDDRLADAAARVPLPVARPS